MSYRPISNSALLAKVETTVGTDATPLGFKPEHGSGFEALDEN